MGPPTARLRHRLGFGLLVIITCVILFFPFYWMINTSLAPRDQLFVYPPPLLHPDAQLQDITDVLHPEGIWILQLTDLVTMLKLNAFDNICHEHLEYYSMRWIVAAAGGAPAVSTRTPRGTPAFRSAGALARPMRTVGAAQRKVMPSSRTSRNAAAGSTCLR